MNSDRGNRFDNVAQPSIVLATQRGMASARTSSRSRVRRDAGVPTSTLTPSASSNSTPIERISIGRARLELDEKVDVAVGPFITAGDRAEDGHGSAMVASHDRFDLFTMSID